MFSPKSFARPPHSPPLFVLSSLVPLGIPISIQSPVFLTETEELVPLLSKPVGGVYVPVGAGHVGVTPFGHFIHSFLSAS